MADFHTVRRAQTTLEALEVIANHVTQLPGRKNPIWVSGSFPFDRGLDPEDMNRPNREVRPFSPEMERAARALNNANMAVYPLDARGLMGNPFFSAGKPGSRLRAFA
jgi:hypothetical protein